MHVEVAEVIAGNAHDGNLVGIVGIVGVNRRHRQRIASINSFFSNGIRFCKRHLDPLAFRCKINAGDVGNIVSTLQCQLFRQPSLAIGNSCSRVQRNIDTRDAHSHQRRIVEQHSYIVGLGLQCTHAFQRSGAGVNTI